MTEYTFLFAQIEITTRCNGGCTYCDHGSYTSVQCRDMELETLRAVLNKLQGRTSLLHLQGVGEPFLHSKLLEVLKLCREMGFTTSTTTNLSICDLGLIKLFDYLYISLDGISPANCTKRKGLKQEKILTNLERLLCSPFSTKFYLTSVASFDNIAGLVEVLKFYREHRNSFEGMVISPILDFENPECMLSQENRNTLRAIFADYSNLNLSAEFLYAEPCFDCAWLRRCLYIDVSGKLRICCVRASADSPAADFLNVDGDSGDFSQVISKIAPMSGDVHCGLCMKNGTNLLWGAQ